MSFDLIHPYYLSPSSLGPINSSTSQCHVLFCLIIIIIIIAVVICPLRSVSSDHILFVSSHIMRGATLSPNCYQPPRVS